MAHCAKFLSRDIPCRQLVTFLIPVGEGGFIAPVSEFLHRFFVRRSDDERSHRRRVAPERECPKRRTICFTHAQTEVAGRVCCLAARSMCVQEERQKKSRRTQMKTSNGYGGHGLMLDLAGLQAEPRLARSTNTAAALPALDSRAGTRRSRCIRFRSLRTCGGCPASSDARRAQDRLPGTGRMRCRGFR